MKNIKISYFIFIIISIFFIIDFIGYRVLHKHMVSDHEKDTKILFHGIKSQTSDFLAKLLYEYNTEKEVLKNKHKDVLDYLNDHDLNASLDEIHKRINEGYVDKPYNIYITNKDLVIKNTTYKNDMNFDLSFAKELFEEHKAENMIGCSAPIREKISQQFFFYTDSYITKNGDDRSGILQLSYTYNNNTLALSELQKLIKKYPSIKEVKAYSMESNGYTYEILFKETDLLNKPDLKSKTTSKKKALKAVNKLDHNELIVEHFDKEGISYQLLTMSVNSYMVKDMKIIYTVLLDESGFQQKLKNLDMIMLLMSFMGVIAIIIIVKVRNNEVKFSEHDKFIKSAMHEIKTPLSVITLNNELRTLEQGKDSYSLEIDNALKVLNHSYSTLSFIVNRDKVKDVIELLSLSELVNERIDFFQSIADTNEKKIISDISCDCRVKMTYQDLIRLIDNNLSNAIKYSPSGSVIKVVMYDNLLSFNNMGKVIENKEKIFSPYVRENTTVGGYGLGLSIIKDIAEKYEIDISLLSDKQNGTTFTYFFKCHTDDTQEE